jgi:hypothetical protein
MAPLPDRPASRTGRDRDLLPARRVPGPYEAPYDVRIGYQPPERPVPPGREEGGDETPARRSA